MNIVNKKFLRFLPDVFEILFCLNIRVKVTVNIFRGIQMAIFKYNKIELLDGQREISILEISFYIQVKVTINIFRGILMAISKYNKNELLNGQRAISILQISFYIQVKVAMNIFSYLNGILKNSFLSRSPQSSVRCYKLYGTIMSILMQIEL